jgi:sulfide:quinone oxidoreductase
MDIRTLSPEFAVSPQIGVADVGVAAAQGYRAIVCNRPDGEGDDQTPAALIRQAAADHGLGFAEVPIRSGGASEADVAAFAQALDTLPQPILAYCRTGTRSATLWSLAKAPRLSADAILKAASGAGYDLAALRPRLESASGSVVRLPTARRCEVVIVGGGAGGVSVAASLKKRRPDLDVVIVEPRDEHYYQPGWTLVGGGVFRREDTMKPMDAVIPKGVKRIRAAVAAFEPERNQVVLEDGERLSYRALVVAPGLELDWDRIEGLRDTLGRNGVTSNYMFDMAPYTWELVQNLRAGRALFTQPPMPIKCAGAPQKAMYLSCDHWFRSGRLKDIDVEFCNAGGVLFGVPDYVPALMGYVKKYDATLSFLHTLVAVDGRTRKAWFDVKQGETTTRIEKSFDMLHVCPPQRGLGFVRRSALADAAGWVEVSPETLQHARFGDVFGLGDGCSTPNAKTAAAVRKQAPVVAENVVAVLEGRAPRAVYDGYGSCPLTVERGKIVLAEFAYGGKLAPSFPDWLIDGKKPSRAAWLLKEKLLPPLYWHGMFRGREWMVAPKVLPMAPAAHEAQDACDFQEGRKVS